MPLLLQLPAAAALPGRGDQRRPRPPPLSSRASPVTYRFAKHSVELDDGIVTASGYACACAASSSCGYSGKKLIGVLSPRRAGAVGAAVREARGGGSRRTRTATSSSATANRSTSSFHALRLVAAEAFPEEFRAAAGVPMTVCAAGASPAPQGTGQEQQPGGMASWEPSGVQVHGVMAELPSAPTQEDVEMLTEEEEAGLCLLGLRESGSSTNSNPICGAQGPVTEEDAAGGDHAMPDVEEIRNVAVENGSGLSSLLAATPIKVSVGETRWQSERSRYQLESYLKDVRGLLTTGLLEGFKVIYRNNEVCAVPAGCKVENIGRISGQGYSCGCSECGYSSQVLNACEFEQHSGESSCNQNDRIFLETGISLYRVVKALKHYKLNVLGEFIEEIIGFPPNMVEYNKWKGIPGQRVSFVFCSKSSNLSLGHLFHLVDNLDTLRKKDDLDALASDRCSTQRGSVVQEFSLANYLKESPSSSIANLNWSVFKRRSERHVKREVTETSTPSVSGSPDKGIPLFTGTSKKSDSEEAPNENIAGRLGIDGVKPDSPGPTAVTSDSSKHNPINLGMPLPGSATITSEPSPDHSIGSKSKEQKTRDTTLHPLLFKEGGLPDNTFLTYKLKNGEALKQGYKRGTYIVCNCCNQREGLTLHKLALQLQDHLNSNGFDKANICGFDDYPILTSPGFGKESSTPSGPIVPLKRTLQERVVETESCYFCGDGSTTIGKIDAEMIVFCNQCERPCHVKCYNNLLEKKKLCQNKLKNDSYLKSLLRIAYTIIIIIIIIYCILTCSPFWFCCSAHVVSTAILKVQTEEVAELVLVATRRECRKKGYFVLLLKSIETYLRACNVKTLTAPVDPEMVPIWSEKLGFTILSAEEKKSMLEVHPLVMFENLLLVQKSLA
ncbi:hypothetical protein PR202_ga26169 [Eleusine coracana subsp. coracana]|uniref:N-acetyltransferase domain-containing protein n=1 Tax=Eleusine coracana subsp. coracana TaxID=191504 RepID=A0AAV5DB77_ELECO|nr:hypothetical protein PR202_ga26169 [Eleusine coracana subsp. coracana]